MSKKKRRPDFQQPGRHRIPTKARKRVSRFKSRGLVCDWCERYLASYAIKRGYTVKTYLCANCFPDYDPMTNERISTRLPDGT